MFVHLHTHSHYSLLDGLNTIDNLVAKAKSQGANALALTDHGTMYGVIEFYQKCQEAGIKPLIGVEAYVTPGLLTDKNTKEKPYHLLLLAKNNRGYKNLLKLTSIAHLEGFYYKPRLDWPTLKKYGGGLIAATACLNGPLARHIAAGQIDTAEKNLKILLDTFGPKDVYLELQHRNFPEQKIVNQELKKMAAKYDLPLIATNDIHYLDPEDDQAHDVLLCIQTKQKQSDKNRLSYLGENYAMLSEEQMRQLFADTPEAIDNTQKLADRCHVDIELGIIQLPAYELPAGVTAEQYLLDLCIQGLQIRYNLSAANITAEIKKRLDYELSIITKTGYAAYFLIVQDFVNWAKNNKIIVGPGRGSAAGSLVSYLIGITNIDPLKYNLLFERFLNPERISMPDIDLDFADERREEVIQYVEKKYHKDHVAQIITFGTMAARAAIRDVGRVMGYSYLYCDQLAKMVPMFTTLKQALATVEELKKIYAEDTEAQRLLEMAKHLEGLARHSSVHACGVLITKEELTQYIPLQYASGDDQTVVSQYSLHPVEDLGLLKMDFLGLKNLTVLEKSLKIIAKTKNVKIDLDDLPLDDQKTFSLLKKGDTTGVFQLESGGMKRYLKMLKPSELEDIIAMVSLYRPGPMEFIPDFINRKHGQTKPTYLHPKLKPILEKTHGIAIYQEQIMEIARELAGFTYGQADVLRKAVGKKIKKLLDEQEEAMVRGMVKNGLDKPTAQRIWEFIVPFARYGFNRAHAACYAMIAYQTAYLKANYPEAFMAALLTSDQDNIDRVTIEITECRKMGIEVLPPDINESFNTFAVVPDPDDKKLGKIRFGLNAVKNVGHNIAAVIIEERKANGPYRDLDDFLNRITDKDLNRKSLESLIKCGAFDRFLERGQALGNLDQLLQFNKKNQSEYKSKQSNLFSDLPLNQKLFSLKLDEFPPISTGQKLSWEKELLGLYLSDHPFKDQYRLLADKLTPLSALKSKESKMVRVAGIITTIKKIITHGGKSMLFVTLEDSTASVEILVFPKILSTTFGLWQDENQIIINGKVSSKDGQPKILAESAQILTPEKIAELNQEKAPTNRLLLNLPPEFDQKKMKQLKSLLDESPGLTPVYLAINNGHQRRVKTSLKIMPTKNLEKKVLEFLGEQAWKLENF